MGIRLMLLTLVLALVSTLAPPAHSQTNAQAYPAKPIRVIVPYPPGGPADLLPRLIGAKLTEAWGQAVVVDNRPGGAGNIGMDLGAKALPDGYTLLVAPNGNLVVNPHMYKLPYDVFRDLAPVTLMAQVQNVLVINPEVPAKTLTEFIALARAQPGKFSYASPGNGSQPHMAGELLKSMAGIDLLHVPYNGTAPAMKDLLGGQVTMMFAQSSSALPQVKAGKLRALGLASSKRSAAAPEIPTVAEQNLPGFEAVSWYALMAPAGTLPETIAKLQHEVARIVQLPEIREKLAGLGAEPVGNTPAELAAIMKTESARYAVLVQKAGIRAD
jgi:tripartite-type tricarboxylate transporter receptor subunit TctC